MAVIQREATQVSNDHMAIIQLNPRTPGQRFMQVADFSDLTDKPPEKNAAGAA